MRFIADLHVHSRYSRATSPEADLRGFYRWAQVKGISLVGTGDFTHPKWFSHIKELLTEKDGLLRFKDPPEGSALSDASPADIPVRFILSAEISSIYKKKGETRKVHSLLLAPSLEAVEKLSRKLALVGNIASDGRPILGLDPKILLEMLLETAPEGMLIPAHIWTPWFSVFGSKSGFDAIEDCFEELTPRIHALETGLSSDPPMNWRWSALDRFRLVSNSDAHSPANLGREANLFDADLGFTGVTEALATGRGFLGTFEFYPEEGKYHVDGHRKCGVRMEPAETLKREGLCPVCGKPVTVGVLHRVLALADRASPAQPRPSEGFRYLVPLAELLSEIAGTGPSSKPVAAMYQRLIGEFGSEYGVLFDTPLQEIETRLGRLVGESVRRVREGRVSASPGYDGEFGRITVFEKGELETLRGQDELFQVTVPARGRKRTAGGSAHKIAAAKAVQPARAQEAGGLDADQEEAASSTAGATMIFAGPGSGKTRVLTQWVARRLREHPEAPGALAVTFTNRAAAEMRQRLSGLLGARAGAALVSTFHALCFSLLREADPGLQTLYGEAGREELLRIMMPGEPRRRIQELSRRIEKHFEGVEAADTKLSEVIRAYEEKLGRIGAADISSLVERTASMLRRNPAKLQGLRARFPIIAVDELQDINSGQYELLRLLAGVPEAGAGQGPKPAEGPLFSPASESPAARILCIGDPDQAIYSFRGSDSGLFPKLGRELDARTFRLTRTYRSTATIARAASAVLEAETRDSGSTSGEAARAPLVPVRPEGALIRIVRAADPADEGRSIAESIHALVGGVDAISAEASRGESSGYSFADIAVLFRTRAVRDALLPALSARSIPATFREGSPVHAREPMRSLVAALRLLLNPRDIASLSCLLTRAGAETATAEAARLLDSGCDPADLAARLGDELPQEARVCLSEVLGSRKSLLDLSASSGIVSVMSGLLERAVPLDHEDPDACMDEELLRETAAEHGSDLQGFLHRLSLLTVESEGPVRSEKVRLLTFHAAKGLEFPVVFIAGAEEGITPMSEYAKRAPLALAEERRLFYVAVTRTMDRLFISHCARRNMRGQWEDQTPSRFLAEIPADCAEDVEARDRRTKRGDGQLPLFG